jgi:hypothetical protein
MTQLGHFLVLIGVIAVALAGVGGLVGWYNEQGRRIRRGLRRVLKGDTHALIIAPGRGRGAGFNFTTNAMAVAWDTGGWCLIYRIDELLGVELIIDGQVAARVYRGEARRPLDVLGGAERQVALRLVFDDLQYPDFHLELWSAELADRRGESTAAEAVDEGNRWLARIESIFRRKPPNAAAVSPSPAVREPEAPRTAESPASPPSPRRPAAPPVRADGRQDLPFDADDEETGDDDADDDDAGGAAAR